MPIFEFICTKCNEEFETLVFSSEEPVECPKCKSAEVQKRLSAFSTSAAKSPSCGTSDYCPSPHKHKCSSGCCH